MCISALPGDVVMDCMHMYVLCPPGKPGVQLFFYYMFSDDTLYVSMYVLLYLSLCA